MSSLTKEELRSALISHGVTELPPQSAKKDELVALYEEHVSPVALSAGDFSSDDEVYLNTSPSKRASTASKASRVSNVSKASKSSKSPKKNVPGDSMAVDDVDIEALSDDELFEKLKENGISAGPIVASTRKFYKKKLAMALKMEPANTSNGNGAEYSDTDPEDEEEEPAEVTSEATVTTRRSASARNSSSSQSQKKSPTKSPFGSMFKEVSGLRSRGAQDKVDAGNGKLTPTPRRSIHSFKVSESTKEVITRHKDGTETRDIQRSVERTENGKVVSPQPKAGCLKYLVMLLKLIAVLAVLAGLYLAFTYKNDGVTSFDQIIDAVNHAQAEAGQDVPPASQAPPAARAVDV